MKKLGEKKLVWERGRFDICLNQWHLRGMEQKMLNRQLKVTWRKVPFEIETMVVIPLKIIIIVTVGMGEITKG